MARWPRIFAPGLPVHVTQRGHNREPVFLDDEDFAQYREIVRRVSERSSCAIHAYALMTNHVHLLLTPQDETSTSRMMQRVNSWFVQYWNDRHRRSGTRWNGRFKAALVGSERYFLLCSRYIDLNPVSAGLAVSADAYQWSSYASLACGVPDPLVTPHAVYLALGGSPALRQRAYSEFCAEKWHDHAVPLIRTATRGGSAIGNERALTRLTMRLKRPVSRCGHGGDRRSIDWQTDAFERLPASH